MDSSEDGNKYICLEAKIKLSSYQFSSFRRWVDYEDASTFMLRGPLIVDQVAEESESTKHSDRNVEGSPVDEISKEDKEEGDVNDDDAAADDDGLSPFYGGKVSFM